MPALVRRLFLCACAGAGFVGMAAAIHRALPMPVPEVTPKLDYLKSHLGDFDTIFIGSSRIYHGVSPKAFDAAMAAAGSPVRSFNLGVNAMWPPESLHMARALLAMHPPALRRVFLEVALDRGLPDPASLTVRDVYFQDLDEAAAGIQRARLDYKYTPKRDRRDKVWDDLSRAGTLFTRNEFNIGRLIPRPAFDPEPPGRLAMTMLGPDGDGYYPERQPLTPSSRKRLEEGIAAIRARKLKDHPPDPLNMAAYARVRDLMARDGVELTLIAAPVTTREYHASKDAPPGIPILAFDDPDHYPELYTPEHRYDAGHLNDVGALIFSRELAQAYLTGKVAGKIAEK